MGGKGVLTKMQYTQLAGDIRDLIREGKLQAEAAVRQKLVETYWNVGKRLTEEGLTQRANYGESVLEDLAQEININLTTLKQSILFFNRYKISTPRGTNLSWAHYRELSGISDGLERKYYEGLAIDEGLTRNQLVDAIKRQDYVETQAAGTRKKTAKKLTRPTAATYVYKAIVQRVIDGDTLLLRVDLGFQVWKEQRVRLAGIDCPEMKTPEGRVAFEYVRDRLARVDFVMVKTNQVDIYGRYVGHVFYDLNETSKARIFHQGQYLSQELLDKNLAVRV